MSWTTSGPVGDAWTSSSDRPLAIQSDPTWTVSATNPIALVSSGASFGPVPEYRLNKVVPLPVNPSGDLDFVHEFDSTGYFILAENDGVRLESRITDGP